jgi:hypothetical protein
MSSDPAFGFTVEDLARDQATPPLRLPHPHLQPARPSGAGRA